MPSKSVMSREGILSGTLAETLEECSVLCQINDNCAVAEYNTLNGNNCNLFPVQEDSATMCQDLLTSTSFTAIPMPCSMYALFNQLFGHS